MVDWSLVSYSYVSEGVWLTQEKGKQGKEKHSTVERIWEAQKRNMGYGNASIGNQTATKGNTYLCSLSLTSFPPTKQPLTQFDGRVTN